MKPQPTFVDRVMRVSGPTAKTIIKKLRGGASGDKLRAQLTGSLEVDAKAVPQWLVVEHGELGRLVHLATPLFDLQAADGDEFWGDPPKRSQLVWKDGKGTRREPNGTTKDDKITDNDVPSIACYETSSDVVLTDIAWHEPAPKTKKAFRALLSQAEAAFFGELEAFDPKPALGTTPATSTLAPTGSMYRGGASREGVFEGAFAKAPKVKWARANAASGSEWGGSPIASGDFVVAAGAGFAFTIEAHDVKTGKARWSTTPSKSQSWIAGEMAIAHERVLAPTNEGVFAYDLKTGKLAWKAPLSNAVGALLVAGDLVLAMSKKGVHAFSISKQGQKVWTHAFKESGGSATLRDGVIYVHGDDHLWSIAASDGKTTQWKVPAMSSPVMRAAPVATETSVLFMADAYEVACVDRASGKQRWKTKLPEAAYEQAIAVSGGVAVIGDRNGSIHALDAGTGKKRWSAKASEDSFGTRSGPVIAGDTVIAVFHDDDECALTGFDLAKGKIRWRVSSEAVLDAMQAEQAEGGSGYEGAWQRSAPFIADGTIYAQSDGGVVALR